jgi:hypothetical protein
VLQIEEVATLSSRVPIQLHMCSSIQRISTKAKYDAATGELIVSRGSQQIRLGTFPHLGWQHGCWYATKSTNSIASLALPECCLRDVIPSPEAWTDRCGQLEFPGVADDLPTDEHMSEHAWLLWYRQIPQEVRDCLIRFPNGHLRLLGLFSADARATTDLCVSNPALAYILAHPAAFGISDRLRTPVGVRYHLRKRQRDLLKMIGFPGTEADEEHHAQDRARLPASQPVTATT